MHVCAQIDLNEGAHTVLKYKQKSKVMYKKAKYNI